MVLIVYSTVFARDIAVKYRKTPVNVDSFKEYSLKSSSLVKEMLYDEENKYLLVRLNKNFYQYCFIEKNIIQSWVNADSLGSFYRNNIKGKFSCRKRVYNQVENKEEKKDLKFFIRTWLSSNIYIINKKNH